MATVTVGPVIGKVTDTVARVAIEVDRGATVSCVATDAAGNAIRQRKQFEKDRFSAFELSRLLPDTKYAVSFQGAASSVSCHVKTFPTVPGRMNVGAVSCNFTVFREGTDLWADLRDRNITPGNVDLLLHVGDQIYGDSAFQEAETILDGRTSGTQAQRRKIKELYRRLYRMTWRHPATRDVLANVPNLMIWDDHEIRDDWGSRNEDSDPTTAAYHIGTLGHEVFREYQRQLWDDPANWPPQRFEDHVHKWGAIGVLFVDQRGGRSFERDAVRPYLGVPQWNRIAAALARGGDLDDVRALIVVTSVPLVYLGDSITNGGAGVVDDLRDHWAYGSHRVEQIQMMRALRNWKAVGGRELLVVGGDVHIGCHTNIEHNASIIYRQLVTSPITNKPPGWFAYTALKGLLESDEALTDSYSFEHSNYTRNRNYGFIVIRIPADAAATPRISGGLEQP